MNYIVGIIGIIGFVLGIYGIVVAQTTRTGNKLLAERLRYEASISRERATAIQRAADDSAAAYQDQIAALTAALRASHTDPVAVIDQVGIVMRDLLVPANNQVTPEFDPPGGLAGLAAGGLDDQETFIPPVEDDPWMNTPENVNIVEESELDQ